MAKLKPGTIVVIVLLLALFVFGGFSFFVFIKANLLWLLIVGVLAWLLWGKKNG